MGRTAIAQLQEMMLCLSNAHQTVLISLSRASSSRSPRLGNIAIREFHHGMRSCTSLAEGPT